HCFSTTSWCLRRILGCSSRSTDKSFTSSEAITQVPVRPGRSRLQVEIAPGRLLQWLAPGQPCPHRLLPGGFDAQSRRGEASPIALRVIELAKGVVNEHERPRRPARLTAPGGQYLADRELITFIGGKQSRLIAANRLPARQAATFRRGQRIWTVKRPEIRHQQLFQRREGPGVLHPVVQFQCAKNGFFQLLATTGHSTQQ